LINKIHEVHGQTDLINIGVRNRGVRCQADLINQDPTGLTSRKDPVQTDSNNQEAQDPTDSNSKKDNAQTDSNSRVVQE